MLHAHKKSTGQTNKPNVSNIDSPSQPLSISCTRMNPTNRWHIEPLACKTTKEETKHKENQIAVDQGSGLQLGVHTSGTFELAVPFV